MYYYIFLLLLMMIIWIFITLLHWYHVALTIVNEGWRHRADLCAHAVWVEPGQEKRLFILLNASDMRSALNFGLGLLHNCVFLHSAYSTSPAFYFNRLLTVLF